MSKGLKKAIMVMFSLVICLSLVTVPRADSFNAKTADSFSSNGDLISGWYWVRATGHEAQWDWNPIADNASKIWINFALLVTNKTSGGSGYSTSVDVTVKDAATGKELHKKLRLKNPFKPRYPGNTGGVGYRAYGAIKIQRSFLENGFSIKIVWPPSKNYHIGAKLDAATLAYTD
jgi:hypothetical protein